MIVLLSYASFIYDFDEYEDLDYSIFGIAVLFVDSSYLAIATVLYDFGEYEDLDYSSLRIAVRCVDSSYLGSDAMPNFCMQFFFEFCGLIRFITCFIKKHYCNEMFGKTMTFVFECQSNLIIMKLSSVVLIDLELLQVREN